MTRFLLIFIIAAGLLLRIDAAWQGSETNMPDSVAYERIAKNIAQSGSFQQEEEGSWAQPASNYSPGVPLLLGGVFYLLGTEDPRLGRIVLALLATLAIPATFWIGRRLAGDWAGVVGAALVAFYPTLVADSGMILTEGLAGALLAGAIVLALRGRAWIGAGALVALAIMVRPDFLILTIVLGAVLLWQKRQAGPAIMIGAAILLLAPWSIVLSNQIGHFVPVSTGGGQALFTGSYLPSEGDPQNLSPKLLQENPSLLKEPVIKKNPPPPGQPLPTDQILVALALQKNPAQKASKTLSQLGKRQYIAAIGQPLRLTKFMSQKFYHTWLRGRAALTAPLGGHLLHLLIIATAFLGLCSLRGRQEWPVLLAIVGVVTLIALLLVASPRRVLAIWPIVAALSGAGIVFLAAKLENFWPSSLDNKTRA